MIKTKKQLIKYLENYHESRCSDLASEGREDDALSIYDEIVVDGEDPDSYLFISLHKVV
jgi:pentatricopeptide repeat protein